MEAAKPQLEPICILCREKSARFSMPGATDKLEVNCSHCNLSYRIENVVLRSLDLPVPVLPSSIVARRPDALPEYEN
jgi:hypothetical protein